MLTLTLQLCRAIDLEELKLLRVRVMECQRREEVNHPQRCRQEVEDYMKAFKKYRSEGEGPDQICCMVARDFFQCALGELGSLLEICSLCCYNLNSPRKFLFFFIFLQVG